MMKNKVIPYFSSSVVRGWWKTMLYTIFHHRSQEDDEKQSYDLFFIIFFRLMMKNRVEPYFSPLKVSIWPSFRPWKMLRLGYYQFWQRQPHHKNFMTHKPQFNILSLIFIMMDMSVLLFLSSYSSFNEDSLTWWCYYNIVR